MVEDYEKKGALKSVDLIQKKIEEGLWSADKEGKLASLEKNISLMSQKKNKASIQSQIEDIEELIRGYEKDYLNILHEKNHLLNLSAESLASSAQTEFLVHLSFYNDENLKDCTFPMESVIEFDSHELGEIFSVYKDCSSFFTIENIRKVSASERVKSFVKASAGAETFFGKNGCDLSLYQIKLFDYSKYFIGLLEKIEEISAEERSDPDEIERIFILEMNKEKEKQGVGRDQLMKAFSKTKES